MLSSYVIIMYNHHVLSSYIIITYYHHLLSSYIIIIYYDHILLSYIIIIYDNKTKPSLGSRAGVILYYRYCVSTASPLQWVRARAQARARVGAVDTCYSIILFPKQSSAVGVLTVLVKGPCKVRGIRRAAGEQILL